MAFDPHTTDEHATIFNMCIWMVREGVALPLHVTFKCFCWARDRVGFTFDLGLEGIHLSLYKNKFNLCLTVTDEVKTQL